LKSPPVNISLFEITLLTTNNLTGSSRLDIEHLVFEKGPKRVGPFSHAVKAGDFIFITGQMPTLPDNPNVLVSNDVEEQTHQVMKNLMNVLKQSGSSLDRVTFVRVYLVNFQDFDKVNKIYKSYFDENKLPARTCIGVTGLAIGASVEIDLIAKQ
jgi:2-iminobutanoate/2-iminopropanoate deaminase|tara:strand:- start:80 stop:544 length:465 start_codon:yes stop_codon:yes gene_type:complete